MSGSGWGPDEEEVRDPTEHHDTDAIDDPSAVGDDRYHREIDDYRDGSDSDGNDEDGDGSDSDGEINRAFAEIAELAQEDPMSANLTREEMEAAGITPEDMREAGLDPDGLDTGGIDAEPGNYTTSDLDDHEALAALVQVEAALDERWPEAKLEPSLDRINLLMELLGSPQGNYPVIHIAGTNGKTSVARMIDSLLSAAHQRVGRYTSPHMQSVTERIAIDGAPISAARYVETFREIEPYIALVDARSAKEGGPAMSKFEVLTAMAYAAFADAPVDVAVVETGMGGSWDATSVVRPQVCVITPIGMDHTDYLGETIAEIASEKAGIIPANNEPGNDCVAVIANQDPEAMEVLLRRAVQTDTAVARLGTEFALVNSATAVGGQLLTLRGVGGEYDDVFLPIHGRYQGENAALALAAVETFFGAGPGRAIDSEIIRTGFAAVASPGRLERLASAPAVFADAAHNEHGARALAGALKSSFRFRGVVGVVGILDGKDVNGIFAALEPVFDRLVITRAPSPRAVDASELAQIAGEHFGLDRITVVDRFPDAVSSAMEIAGELATTVSEAPVTASAAPAENSDRDGSKESAWDSGWDGIPGDEDDEDAELTPAEELGTSGIAIVFTGSVVTAGAARAAMGKEPE